MTIDHLIDLYRKGDSSIGERMEEEWQGNADSFAKGIISTIESRDLTFPDWNSIAMGLAREGQKALAITILKALIRKEKELTSRLRKARGEDKEKFQLIIGQTVCSLGRELNNLGCTLAEVGKKREARQAFFKTFEADLEELREYLDRDQLDRIEELTARTFPGFQNIVSVLSSEAEDYLKEGDYLLSFLLSWVSLEMILRSMWIETLLRFRERRKWSGTRIKRAVGWTVEIITEILSLEGTIGGELRDTISNLRKKRNVVFHGTGEVPSHDDAKKCIKATKDLLEL